MSRFSSFRNLWGLVCEGLHSFLACYHRGRKKFCVTGPEVLDLGFAAQDSVLACTAEVEGSGPWRLRFNMSLPMGPIVVPFWDYLIVF